MLNYVVAIIFSQINKNDILRLITFILKKISLTKYNYKIYDKKNLTIIRIFEK